MNKQIGKKLLRYIHEWNILIRYIHEWKWSVPNYEVSNLSFWSNILIWIFKKTFLSKSK